MIAQLFVLAIELASNPVALVGYLVLGIYASRLWQVLKYGFLWGLAIHFFAIALGRTELPTNEMLAIMTALRLAGAVIITVAIFYLARALRTRGGPGGRGSSGDGPGRPQRAPHLRRIK